MNQIRDTEVRIAETLPELGVAAAICGQRVGLPTQSPDTITCSSPMSGRYVKVFRSSTENHFCVLEIEVFASSTAVTTTPTTSPTTIPTTTITSSSVAGANVASGKCFYNMDDWSASVIGNT